ncbi:MAG: hypothetical protein KGZ97_07845 [Bacteroidetes bacterium]|nr:hypothetical protein [Bacteroidota bacterium]
MTQTNEMPSGLKVLGYLSLIGGGIAAFFSLLSMIPGINIVSVLALLPGVGIFIVPGGIAPFFPHFIMFILYGVSIFGVLMMLKLKKLGFFLYMIAQILIFILGTILNFGPFSLILSLASTVVFILLFAQKSKHMS